MGRIIINIDDYSLLSDYEAIEYIKDAVSQGKISKEKGQECYCFLTTYDDINVQANITKNGTHTFFIYRRGI